MKLIGINIVTAIKREIAKLKTLKKTLIEQEKNYGKDFTEEKANCDASINHYEKFLASDECI